MRTTLALEDDALVLLRCHAQKRGISLGAAASDLIRNGSRCHIPIKWINGLPVFDASSDFPPVTDEMVWRILDDE